MGRRRGEMGGRLGGGKWGIVKERRRRGGSGEGREVGRRGGKFASKD